jgi:serpin B
MTYAGARGQTAAEMKKTLHFNLDNEALHPAMGKLGVELTMKKKGLEVSLANALWGQKGYGFLKEFLELNKKNYKAGLNEVDFAGESEQARQTINSWVEDHTNDKIKELLKKGIIKPDTTLILTNAIYFKGTWKCQFDKKETRKVRFHLSEKEGVTCDMMHMKKVKMNYFRGEAFAMLELPYEGGRFTMLIFLPDKVDGLPGVEKLLTNENLKTWTTKMYEKKLDDIYIPRFKMTRDFELAEILPEMGMPSAFGSRADFSGMTGRRDLFISNVIHKAFVDVNEEGTEAAAATAVVMGRGARPARVIFRADRPFAFLIRDTETGAVLFMGRVTNPTNE